MIEVYKHGTPVKTVIGGIKGILIAICIRGEKVSYELSYFVDNEYRTTWLDECEFIVSKKNRKGSNWI